MPLEQQHEPSTQPSSSNHSLSLSPRSAPPSQDQELQCLSVLAAVVKGLAVSTLFGIESARVVTIVVHDSQR